MFEVGQIWFYNPLNILFEITKEETEHGSGKFTLQNLSNYISVDGFYVTSSQSRNMDWYIQRGFSLATPEQIEKYTYRIKDAPAKYKSGDWIKTTGKQLNMVTLKIDSRESILKIIGVKDEGESVRHKDNYRFPTGRVYRYMYSCEVDQKKTIKWFPDWNSIDYLNEMSRILTNEEKSQLL